MIADFHFLRPEWLWGVAAAVALFGILSRREDLRARWGSIIAPQLLDNLIVGRRRFRRLRPVHLTAALMALGSIAAAGPTFERERPPFVQDKAPLAIAIDLSTTMDAIDISPTRLERAKLKVHDLLALRQGARTALFAYAGSAHLVLPLTDDASLIDTYVDSLATALMPVPGKDTAKALGVVNTALADEDMPGTILFITDGVEPRAFDALKNERGRNEIMVLAIGTAEGGPVKAGKDEFLTGASGRVIARLDVEGLRKLKSQTGVQVATVTADDSDVQWIVGRAQTHLQQKEADADTRWNDVGWWLMIPITALSALWFRRGWTIRWVSVLLLWLAIGSLRSAGAAEWRFADLWLTPDQQGRLAYDKGDYATASERFAEPMWRGAALYRAGKFDEAIDAFARVDSAESYYDQGNALAQLGRLAEAVAAYQEALKRKPDLTAAKANLDLVQRLIPPKQKDDNQEAQDPNEKADDVKFDEKGKKGKQGPVDAARQTADMWMRTIQTTPAQLLRRKFAIEAGERNK